MQYTLDQLKALQKEYIAEQDAVTHGCPSTWNRRDDWYVTDREIFIAMTNDFLTWLERRVLQSGN